MVSLCSYHSNLCLFVCERSKFIYERSNWHLYLFVNVYSFMFIPLCYSFMFIHLCLFIFVYSFICIHLWIFIYVYSFMFIHLCLFIYVYSFMFIHSCFSNVCHLCYLRYKNHKWILDLFIMTNKLFRQYRLSK